MKTARFLHNGVPTYGIAEGDKLSIIKGNIFGEHEKTGETVNITDVKLLSPCEPTKVVAVGLNYVGHAREMSMDTAPFPTIFLKPTTAIIGHDDEIKYPTHMSERVEFEAELAIVIGKTAKFVEEDNAKDYIFGYTCFNDVSARDLQKIDGQWTRAKAFDTFAPFGPVISDELDPDNTPIRAYLNGKVVQDSTTDLMIHKANFLVSAISKIMTLYPGDIIATGTPAGVCEMKIGDVIEIEIGGIGKLSNRLVG